MSLAVDRPAPMPARTCANCRHVRPVPEAWHMRACAMLTACQALTVPPRAAWALVGWRSPLSNWPPAWRTWLIATCTHWEAGHD